MNHWTSQVVAMSLKTGSMQKHLQKIVKDLMVSSYRISIRLRTLRNISNCRLSIISLKIIIKYAVAPPPPALLK